MGRVPLRSLREVVPGELDRLLDCQIEAYRTRFGADLAQSLRSIVDQSLAGNLRGAMIGEPGNAVGYGTLIDASERAILAGLWVLGGHEEEARRLIESLVGEASQRNPRIEVQDLGFGEEDLAPFLEEVADESHSRLYMEASLRPHDGIPAFEPFRVRYWEDGDLLQTAELACKAFEGSDDARLNAGYQSLSGCVQQVAETLGGNAWGCFKAEWSPVAVDESGRMVGFVLMTGLGVRTAHLAQTAVSPSDTGRGIGRALLRRSLAAAAGSGMEKVSLCVTESNERALALYRREGFETKRFFSAFVIETGNCDSGTGKNLPSAPSKGTG